MNLIEALTKNKILNINLTLNVRFKAKLEKYPELEQLVIKQTAFLPPDTEVKTRIHCILQNITKQPVCKICGKHLKMRTSGIYVNTFPDFCSSSCFSGLPTTIKKRQHTNNITYGNSNVLQTINQKDKTKQIMLEKYGVENSLLSVNVREQIKQTNFKKYGSIHPIQNLEIQEKVQNTNLEKYGHKNIFSSPIIREQINQTNLEKYGAKNVFLLDEFQQKSKNEMIKKYGVAYAIQNSTLRKNIENTMIDRYGTTHFLSKDILEQIQKLKNKQWLETEYKIHNKTSVNIANELGVSNAVVLRYLHLHNIEIDTFSKQERQIRNFIQTSYKDEIIFNSRSIIYPFEIDIYLPKLQIGFEFDGVFWHSELNGKDRRYHLYKTDACKKLGIRLVHIWENEWTHQQEIVKSRIQGFLQLNNTIFARKCKIITLSPEKCNEFFKKTHIQGNYGASINYALQYNDTIVACISFGKSRFNKKYEYELIRYSNILNTSVVGGASKLFAHFIKQHNPKTIITYSDKRWNTGQMYAKLNFKFLQTSKPNYFYFQPNHCTSLFSRQTFQKHKLKDKLETFDSSLTEWQNMQINGYDRIWDCGNDVWVWSYQ